MVASVISDRGRRRKRRRNARRPIRAFASAFTRFVLAFAFGFTLLATSAWLNGDLKTPVQEAPLRLRGLLQIDAPSLSAIAAARLDGPVPLVRARRRERGAGLAVAPETRAPEFDVLSQAELAAISQARDPRP